MQPFNLDTARQAAQAKVRRSGNRRRPVAAAGHQAAMPQTAGSVAVAEHSDYRPDAPNLEVLEPPPAAEPQPSAPQNAELQAVESAEPASESKAAADGPRRGVANPLMAPSRSELLRVGVHMLLRFTEPGTDPDVHAVDLVVETLNVGDEQVTADELRDTWRTVHGESPS